MTQDTLSPAADTFSTHDPRDGQVISSYPLEGAARIAERVRSAADAAEWWKDQGFTGRRRILLSWKQAIALRAEDLAATIAAETGKPQGDALLEVMLGLGHLDWAPKHAKKVLGAHGISAGIINANQKATLRYEPFGVVGVIGPWNYPFYTPMGSIAYALSAGNAVVFKPSELSPGTATWIAERWNEVCAQPVFQVATGDKQTGAALVAAGVDKVAFTGSTASAKRVMAACAERLTPLVAECGGKDAVIVVADADLDAAADAIAFGAFGNAGQTCAGVERVYAEQGIHAALVEKVRDRARRLTVQGTEASYGPMTLDTQTATVTAHVADALQRGGRAVLGGMDSIAGRRIDPIILVDVPEDSSALQEETFGPTVVINAVRTIDEAVERANGTGYGLAGAVFTRHGKKGEAIAQRMRAGAVSINSVLGFAGIAALPFGGVKNSGFGRIHGADGLREFSTAKSIARQTMKAPLNLLTMERSDRDMHLVAKMIPLLHGRGR